MKRVIIIFIILISGCLFQSCEKENPGDLVLFDFENGSDLDRLNWKCHSLFSIFSGYSSEGAKSLKVELYPSDYPGVSFKTFQKDWAAYKEICFDVFNSGKEKIDLIVRVDDSPQNTDYADRYNKGFALLPGENKIRISLTVLKTSSGKRNIDLRRIEKLILFVVRPERKTQFYIDNIRLEK